MAKISDEAGRKLIIERFTTPHHFRETWEENEVKDVHHLRSKVCADRLDVAYQIHQNQLINLDLAGSACAISTASADLLVDALDGSTLEEAETLLVSYERLITTGLVSDYESDQLGDLMAFKNVYRQKNRQTCALMLSSFLLNEIRNLK